ncbi:MAG: transposase, partial [Phycisphaerales bacterium]|nr:transposase [Phycisphaerales bacterium]
MTAPLAYLLTWTCYGTCLPADDRGSVDDQHNWVESRFVEPDAVRHRDAVHTMSEPPFVMADAERAVVDTALRETCRIKRWRIHALNVRTNHVHIVIAASGPAPERMMGTLKSWATRALKQLPAHRERRKFWTNQGLNRWLWDEQSV